MKVAFVTPRYGEQVMGGAEGAARSLAEHLVADCGHEVEVYTTCALDHLSWADVLEPGTSTLNGVTVHRFRSTTGRDPKLSDLDARIRVAPSSRSVEDSLAWVAANGPVSESLVDALSACEADVVAFYPYLFYMTVHGINRVSQPAVLHPAAHDEPSLYLPIFQRVSTPKQSAHSSNRFFTPLPRIKSFWALALVALVGRVAMEQRSSVLPDAPMS